VCDDIYILVVFAIVLLLLLLGGKGGLKEGIFYPSATPNPWIRIRHGDADQLRSKMVTFLNINLTKSAYGDPSFLYSSGSQPSDSQCGRVRTEFSRTSTPCYTVYIVNTQITICK
jgi:hypothetical protein